MPTPESLQVPSAQFWTCRTLRPVAEHAPRSLLRWTNFWHPADPLAYPCAAALAGPTAVDVAVKLNEKASEVDPLDYVTQPGSREIVSPLAYTLTQLWIHANPHIAADTTQLEQLNQHGSGTRAALSRAQNKAAEASRVGARKAKDTLKQKAAAVLEKTAPTHGPQPAQSCSCRSHLQSLAVHSPSCL